MTNTHLNSIITECLSELKDFQLATVEHVFKKLYHENRKKHLVADEVGLGKTKIAKGIIAKALERQINAKQEGRSFKVIYICSNQALIMKNLNDLNVLKDPEFINTNRNRLLFLAFKPKANKLFQLSSLTPSTSFNLVKGTGMAEERKLIWLILSKYKVFNRGKRNNGLKLALKGHAYANRSKEWKDDLDKYKSVNQKQLRPEVFIRFKAAVSKQHVDLDDNYYVQIRKELRISGIYSLQNILIRYASLLRVNNLIKYQGQNRLLGLLRKILTDVCIDFLTADLYILDEFQRFKDLLDTNNDNPSDSALIAKKVFETPGAKVLMLSATPFKPYTTGVDDAFNENHFKEFNLVLSFLFNHNKQKRELYEKNRLELFNLLRRPEKAFDAQPKCKSILEEIYRNVISRTERIRVSDDKDTLLKNKILEGFDLKPNDILDFIHNDRIAHEISNIKQKTRYNMVDFAKSAPHPLSFMDGYQLKKDLKEIKNEKSIRQLIKKNSKGWIDLKKIEKYESIRDIPNPRMRLLLEESVYNGMWKQLWLAPSLPYYPSAGAFINAHLNSKILLFSKWKMVPRAIAALVSYESEVLSIANKKLVKSAPLTYTPPLFPGKKKRQPRKPTKLLAIKQKDNKPAKMSTLSILYPSLTLAKLHDLKADALTYNKLGFDEMFNIIVEKCQKLIIEANLNQYCTENRVTANWYWAAPVLLDRFFNYDEVGDWLVAQKYLISAFLSDRSKGDNDEVHSETDENIAAKAHMDEISKVFNQPENYGFGKLPSDLAKVLAMMLIASPSICALKTILECFPSEKTENQLNGALDVATEFYALFDKPESISVIQLNSLFKKRRSKIGDTFYWRNVLEYCVDGNLQSVLDEFAHLIIYDNRTIKTFVNRLAGSVNIRTTMAKVDGAKEFLSDKTTNMRCHYAVDFGNQNMEMEEGRNRVKSVLENFNSPFRPFILATTSIGQEGLDFHLYCRKVMHWNLPTNPIDIEQREGRVNRFKGLVIRQIIVDKYRSFLNGSNTNLWDSLFQIAKEKECETSDKSELVPFWHVESENIKIERIIPLLPFSKEVKQLKKMLDILTLYRLTFGQPRQEELVETLYSYLNKEDIEKFRKSLMIDLSPINYAKVDHGVQSNSL
jgi:hypothetical protein